MSLLQVLPSVDVLAPFVAAPGPIVAFQLDDEAYWHQELHLVFAVNYVVKITAEDRCPVPDCPYLECFTLVVERGQYPAGALRAIEPPFPITELSILRREEWVEPAPEFEGKTVGNNPHVLMSALPGSPHPDAVAAAVVTAGVLLTSDDGRKLAVVTSERQPLNVDLVREPGLVSEVLRRHVVDRVWSAA
jgi:hypothetical protein